jgi:hypothetical protein
VPTCAPTRRSLSVFAAVTAALLVTTGNPAAAATLSFGLSSEFSGAVAPDGPAPWATATFDDSFGGANTVRITLDAHGLTDPESIEVWYFNFDPSLDAALLTFTAVDNSDAVPNGVFGSTDAFKADGDGLYDILFDLPPPPGSASARFTAGETITYDITYTAAISASSFDFLSTPDGGNGPFVTAAHIQSTGVGNEDSAWVTVPEPANVLLFAMGLASAGLSRRRR